MNGDVCRLIHPKIDSRTDGGLKAGSFCRHRVRPSRLQQSEYETEMLPYPGKWDSARQSRAEDGHCEIYFDCGCCDWDVSCVGLAGALAVGGADGDIDGGVDGTVPLGGAGVSGLAGVPG